MRHLKPDPMGEARNPLQVYLLTVALISGIGFLLGTATSGSIQDQLTPLARYGWGLMLTIGSASALGGMFWQGDPRNGLLVKRFGFVGLTGASVIYGASLIVSAGLEGFLVAFSVFGFALACGERAWRINQVIAKVVRRTGGTSDAR